MRVVVDHNLAKPKVRRYGLYNVVRASGTGYYVRPMENEGEVNGDIGEEWIPGHQLCLFDLTLGRSLRVCLEQHRPKTQERAAVGGSLKSSGMAEKEYTVHGPLEKDTYSSIAIIPEHSPIGIRGNASAETFMK